MRAQTHLSLSLPIALLSVSCAATFDPAHFEGSREPPRADPEALLELSAPTRELQTLGRVHDSCMPRPGYRRLQQVALSDLDCSTERLIATLRESAAGAGGEVLIGARCSSRALTGAPSAQRELTCTADVARFSNKEPFVRSPRAVRRAQLAGTPGPSPSEVRRIDEPEASLAFRIRVDFDPVRPNVARRLRSAAEVRELPELPLSHFALGDLAASCESACDVRALRFSVLLAAGRLGAPDVVGVRCFRAASGNVCVGTLAAPERSDER